MYKYTYIKTRKNISIYTLCLSFQNACFCYFGTYPHYASLTSIKEHEAKPRVYYMNIPRKFVAGTVILGDVDEVAVGAGVTLSGEGKVEETQTNGFGDFEFEGLGDNVDYVVEVGVKGYQTKKVKARTMKDLYLGEIVLKK